MIVSKRLLTPISFSRETIAIFHDVICGLCWQIVLPLNPLVISLLKRTWKGSPENATENMMDPQKWRADENIETFWEKK
jgi:hypothetical protein